MIDIVVFFYVNRPRICRSLSAVAIAAEVKSRDTKHDLCTETKASILITCSRYALAYPEYRDNGSAYIQLYIRRRAGAISAIASVRLSAARSSPLAKRNREI